MKLIRFGLPDLEKPGVILNDGRYIDVSDFIPDYDESFFASDQIEELKDYLSGNENLQEISKNERLAAPLARPSKIICVGLNYALHAKESVAEVP